MDLAKNAILSPLMVRTELVHSAVKFLELLIVLIVKMDTF